jgi:hypothetical protein
MRDDQGLRGGARRGSPRIVSCVEGSLAPRRLGGQPVTDDQHSVFDRGFVASCHGLIAAARRINSSVEWRTAGILLISRAAATPTLRAYRSARWAAGIKLSPGPPMPGRLPAMPSLAWGSQASRSQPAGQSAERLSMFIRWRHCGLLRERWPRGPALRTDSPHPPGREIPGSRKTGQPVGYPDVTVRSGQIFVPAMRIA